MPSMSREQSDKRQLRMTVSVTECMDGIQVVKESGRAGCKSNPVLSI